MAVWDRVETPMALPAVVSPEWLADLDDPEFAQMLRGHLLPRSASESGRRAWDSLWRTLGEWPDLQGDAQEVLEGFLRACEAQLQVHPDDKRAQRFHGQVANRLRALDSSRLLQGGEGSRSERLLAAIARHREQTLAEGLEPSTADVALWATLRKRRRR